MKNLSIREQLIFAFLDKDSFTIQDAYEVIGADTKQETIRARIYENKDCFEKVSRSVYKVTKNERTALIICGDGRNPLQYEGVEEGEFDLLISDHPWEDEKSNKGGNRNFTSSYDTFRYTEDDFETKAKLLKEGGFAIEILPAENENNYEYLFNIKQMAKKHSLNYFCLSRWKKGKFVANTGRTVKDHEQIMVFVKGKARNLRPDRKKDKAEPNISHFMSGAAAIVPSVFDFEPPSKSERIHQAEKPVGLYKALLELFSKVGDRVLDAYAGSGAVGVACLETGRDCVLIEKDTNLFEKIKTRLLERVV